MEEFTIGDLGVFLGTVGGVITSILIILQKSHCKKIKICCFECVRNDPSEIMNQPNKNNPINPQQAIQGNPQQAIQENEDQEQAPDLEALIADALQAAEEARNNNNDNNNDNNNNDNNNNNNDNNNNNNNDNNNPQQGA